MMKEFLNDMINKITLDKSKLITFGRVELDMIDKMLENRFKSHIDSRCASPDEITIAMMSAYIRTLRLAIELFITSIDHNIKITNQKFLSMMHELIPNQSDNWKCDEEEFTKAPEIIITTNNFPTWFGKGCSYIRCQWEDDERTGGPNYQEYEPVLTYCAHEDNPSETEGNCYREKCPLNL